MSKIWFVTGASRGLGRHFVEAAVAEGDKVVATARNIDGVKDLTVKHGDAVLPLQLDVTDRAAAVTAAQEAIAHFGRLDVVVNNAGFGLFGAVEEITEQQARDQIDVNYLGALWVTQAVLPHLRAQGSGRIIQVSSTFGVAAFPLFGGHHAAKWALEGFTESLAQEVGPLGIKVTLVEPGAYTTEWAGPSLAVAEMIPAYDPARVAGQEFAKTIVPGDPAAAARGVVEVANAENPPLRVFLGNAGLDWLPAIYADRLKTWDEWADLSRRALK
ncbi:SDR family NAD(P)-dependent oxidoreductase [Streptomyces sp. NPDC058694]|uniref:SDR family NAD(P)-dependent oxidoreductase n=1 Tax=Streptomyces sp. NPDC058694 TaxID=3346603 RepID=UPI00366421F7